MVLFLFDPTEKGDIDQRGSVRNLVEKGSYDPTPPSHFTYYSPLLIMAFFSQEPGHSKFRLEDSKFRVGKFNNRIF
jgi:hypothetical protein